MSAAGWYDDAYDNLDNTNNATANTLVDGLPVAGVLSPYTKRYAKGLSGEFLDAFVFANFDVGDVPVNVKAGQHTVYWGDSLLLGGAIHGISYAQNPLDVWKGFATPGTEAKELFRPRGGITLQAQPTHDLSVAGQWFYNWQADRISGVGQLPDDPGRAQLRRRLVHLRTQSARRVDSRRARVPAPVDASTDIKPPRTSRRPRRLRSVGALESRRGSTARSASTTAIRPTSCRRLMVDAGRRPDGAGSAVLGHRRHAAAGGNALHRQSRTPRRPPICSSSASSARISGAYGDNIHIYGVSWRSKSSA